MDILTNNRDYSQKIKYSKLKTNKIDNLIQHKSKMYKIFII